MPLTIEERLLRTVNGRHGAFTHLITDRPIGHSLDAYGEWAEAEVALFKKLLRRGQTVVEVGANIGTHTVPLAKMLGPEGSVLAFEPFPANYELLCRNLQQNGCFNVTPDQCAISDTGPTVDIPMVPLDSPNNFGAVGIYVENFEKMPCRSTTIDNLNLEALHLLKIDVEGHEREAISGAMETIRRARPILFVESLNQHALTLANDGHTTWLRNTLEPLDYNCWHYITPLYNKQNVNNNAEDYYPGQWSFDLICIPEEKGCIVGLPSAESEMHNADPDQWRDIEIIS